MSSNSTITYGFSTGGKTSDSKQAYTFIEGAVQLPSALNSAANIQGVIQAVTGAGTQTNDLNLAAPGLGGVGGTVQPAQTFSGTVTVPAAPGSGTTFWCIQVNYLTGAVSLKTSSTAAPTADANNVVIFQHVVKTGDVIPWLRAPTLPESWP